MSAKFNNGLDLKLELTDEKFYDLVIDEGELVLEDKFDSTFIVSLFSDKRATPDLQPNNLLRRGWWGDLISDVENYQLGSYLWVLEQSRLNNDTLNRAQDYTRNALQWLVTQDIADSVEVSTSYLGNTGILIEIEITRSNNLVETRYFEIWVNTGARNG